MCDFVEYDVDWYEGYGEEQDDDECLVLCEFCLDEFVVNMVFVCCERVFVLSKSDVYYSDDIGYWYDEYCDGE